MGKLEGIVKVEDVVVLPPWERDEVHYTEVPALLKRLLNRTFRAETVYAWIKKGRKASEGDGRLYLVATKKAGLLYVKRADLDAFLEAT